MKRVVIIGGGITGLAAAYHLQESSHGNLAYTLLESTSRLGGKIASAHENGFVIEGGPDSFLTQKKVTLDLCHALGLDERLLGSDSSKFKTSTYVWSKGQLRPMPEGILSFSPKMILPFLRSRLISWSGKLRMGMELFVPKAATEEDESLAGFMRRRLGNEALDKIAGPLLGGIHAADPEKLSLRSTFPMFLEMEKKYGGLLRSMLRKKRPAPAPSQGQKPPSMFMALSGGLQQLSDAVRDRLAPDAIRLNCQITSIAKEWKHYRVHLADGSSITADGIIFATPSYVTAELIRSIDPLLAEKLKQIRYVSTATVSVGFRRKEIAHPLEGFGFIVPKSEGRKITACSWSSQKFANRAPEDAVLVRVFIGGANAEDLAEQDEAALVEIALQELKVTLGITAKPILTKAYRWNKSTPQYEIGHRERIAAIDALAAMHPGLHLAGAAYRGSGIPDCILSGMQAALEIVEEMDTAECVVAHRATPVSVGS